MAALLSTRHGLIICLLAFYTACGDERSPTLTVDPARGFDANALSGNAGVDRILNESLFLLPATATAELQTRALVSYIGGEFARGIPSTYSLDDLLAENQLSPYAALVLAYQAAGALAWERRILVLDCVPGTVWYLEVNTEDGRFLLDPYQRALAPLNGPLDVKLAYADSFTESAWTEAVGPWPPDTFETFLASWRPSQDPEFRAKQYQSACMRSFYDGKRGVGFPIEIDMADRVKRVFGGFDGSPWDVDALFADGKNDNRSDHAFWGGFESPIGPVTLSHRLHLRGLTRGERYRYVFQEAGTSSGYVVVLPQGISVENWYLDAGDRWVLPFTADATTATVELGLGGGSSLALDWFAVADDLEVLP